VAAPIYAIGDIHGCPNPLRRLLDTIAADAAGLGVSKPQVVFLGDYIDRGPDSKGVLDLLVASEIGERFDAIFLLGNHDLMPIEAAKKRLTANDLHIWLAINGGAETLESYGIDLRRQGQDQAVRQFVEVLPAAHRRFLGDLHLSWSAPGLFFSHAGADPEKALDAQPPEALLYGDRAMFEFDHDWLAPKLREKFGARLVHGHWSTKVVDVWPHRISVDTGCGWRGSENLSAVSIDGDDVRVLTAEGGAR